MRVAVRRAIATLTAGLVVLLAVDLLLAGRVRAVNDSWQCRSDLAEALDGDDTVIVQIGGLDTVTNETRTTVDVCYRATQRNMIQHGLAVSLVAVVGATLIFIFRDRRDAQSRHSGESRVSPPEPQVDEVELDEVWRRRCRRS